MRRSLVAVPLLLVLALTAGCGDDDKDKKDDSKSSEGTSQTSSPGVSESGDPSESTDPTADPTAQASTGVTEEQFCADAEEALHGGSTNEILQNVAMVVAKGLPEQMPKDAVDGIQVLINIAPELEKSSTALKAFQGLSGGEVGDVAKLAGYLTSACGKNLVADIIPSLKQIPSELKSMLPSELTAP